MFGACGVPSLLGCHPGGVNGGSVSIAISDAAASADACDKAGGAGLGVDTVVESLSCQLPEAPAGLTELLVGILGGDEDAAALVADAARPWWWSWRSLRVAKGLEEASLAVQVVVRCGADGSGLVSW